MKFEDMTVTFQPTKPRNPIIIRTEKKQLKISSNGHLIYIIHEPQLLSKDQTILKILKEQIKKQQQKEPKK